MRCKGSRRGSGAGEQGQSTLEFVLTMILFVGFLLFFMKLSFFMAYGNLVQYATFLAARAYQASGPDQNDQRDRAKLTLVRLLKKSEGETGTERFQAIAQGVGGGDPAGAQIGSDALFDPSDDANSWLQGVRYTFRGRLFVNLLGDNSSASQPGQPGAQPPGTVSLISESWLGREVSESECRQEVEEVLRGELDNGC